MFYMLFLLWYNTDLENVKLSKEEFVNTIIINKIFSILSDFVVEEKIDDKDFEVFYFTNFFSFSQIIRNFFVLFDILSLFVIINRILLTYLCLLLSDTTL